MSLSPLTLHVSSFESGPTSRENGSELLLVLDEASTMMRPHKEQINKVDRKGLTKIIIKKRVEKRAN